MEDFWSTFTDTLLLVLKVFAIFAVLRGALILFDINIFIPYLDPFLIWMINLILSVIPVFDPI